MTSDLSLLYAELQQLWWVEAILREQCTYAASCYGITYRSLALAGKDDSCSWLPVTCHLSSVTLPKVAAMNYICG